MKRYCASCGSPTEYTIKKPLFCSSCAKPFDKIEEKPTKSVIENIQIKKPTIAKKIYIEEAELDNDINYDDDQDVNEVPNI
jgi:predicted amidophosphoribosyltransferase